MRFAPGLLAAAPFALTAFAPCARAQGPTWLEIPVPPASQRPPDDETNVEAGRQIYMRRCYYCHGEQGDGNGPSHVERMDPRPRNFRDGLFKFRTTRSGQFPTDDDLYRTITRGIPGTAMPDFPEPFLTPAQRFQVIYFLKKEFWSHLLRWQDILSGQREAPAAIEEVFETPPRTTPAMIEEGRRLFTTTEAGCFPCHGNAGRGDSEEPKLDDWKFPLGPANLTRRTNYKTGHSAREVFRALTTALTGAAMPTLQGQLDSENPAEDKRKRWALSHYVVSLARPYEPREETRTVLAVRLVEGPLPETADDPAWEVADRLDVPLAAQILYEPRWWIPAIKDATVRALYNAEEIALLVQWEDRQKNVERVEPASDGSPDPAIREGRGEYPDSFRLQFPLKPVEGAEKPHFFLGDGKRPVNLWAWRADGEGIEEQKGTGGKRLPTAMPEDVKTVKGGAVYEDGQWSFLARRPLALPDPERHVVFEPGRLVPFALHAFDGGNGETGNEGSISSWYYLRLETKTSPTVYVFGVAGLLLALLVEWLLVRRAARVAAAGA